MQLRADNKLHTAKVSKRSNGWAFQPRKSQYGIVEQPSISVKTLRSATRCQALTYIVPLLPPLADTLSWHQAFKFELMSNGEQRHDMRRFAGSCRFVYNKVLAKSNHEADGKSIGEMNGTIASQGALAR